MTSQTYDLECEVPNDRMEKLLISATSYTLILMFRGLPVRMIGTLKAPDWNGAITYWLLSF